MRQSRIIETAPWGVRDQPRYLNQVVEVRWPGSARQLLKAAQEIEAEGGRIPSGRWGPRSIDVDILLFGEELVSDPDLVIPHPRIGEREFVRRSLGELGVRPAGRW